MEKYLLEASESNEKLEKLNRLLCSSFEVDKSYLQLGKEAFELINEEGNFKDKTFLETCLRMAEIGVESKSLKDKINHYSSEVFAQCQNVVEPHLSSLDYSFSEIAVNFNKLMILLNSRISKKFQSAVKNKSFFVHHSQFNFGEIIKVDENEQVHINALMGLKKLSLQFILKQCICFKDTAAINQFLKGNKLNINEFNQQKIIDETYGDIVPITQLNKKIFIHVMMPKYFKKATLFEQWFRRSLTDKKKIGCQWQDARSLAELLQNIQAEKELVLDDKSFVKVKAIFEKEADKATQVFIFAQCALQFWDKTKDSKAVVTVFDDVVDKAVIWRDNNLFCDICDRLNISQLTSFLMITISVAEDWLNQVVFRLPFRVQEIVQKNFVQLGKPDNLLNLFKNTKGDNLSCDVVVLFWKTYQKDTAKIQRVIGSPEIIFRALNEKGLVGSRIKAHKDLKDLLLSDRGESFQKFILEEGTDKKIKILVDSAKSTSSLDEQERQSLLVRVVRLYDNAKTIIEDSIFIEVTEAILPRITSLVNYRKKQEELAGIIKEIPKNRQDVSIAREHGDLRENAEYQAAKEQQKFLLARREELNNLLENIQPTDFANIEIDLTVIPGCQVDLLIDDEVITYTILGLLDSEPIKKYISFDTPLGLLLIGKSIGDKIDMPNNKKIAVIKNITKLPKELLKWIIS